MRLTVSDARSQLGHLVTRVQDPRTEVILTHHGKPVAAIVSITEVRRIWDLQDTERNGWWWPLYRIRRGGGILRTSWDLVPGRDGKMVTRREAALQMQEVQLTRAAERKILADGGLDPVAGGEVVETRPARRRWWRV